MFTECTEIYSWAAIKNEHQAVEIEVALKVQTNCKLISTIFFWNPWPKLKESQFFFLETFSPAIFFNY